MHNPGLTRVEPRLLAPNHTTQVMYFLAATLNVASSAEGKAKMHARLAWLDNIKKQCGGIVRGERPDSSMLMEQGAPARGPDSVLHGAHHLECRAILAATAMRRGQPLLGPPVSTCREVGHARTAD